MSHLVLSELGVIRPPVISPFLLTRKQDVANEVASCAGPLGFCWRLWRLIAQDVVGGEWEAPSSPSWGTTFLFYTKNNIVPLRVLTASQIPLTVFLPSSAHFYSFGYFILGLCKACFGRVETYCFISGCSALMWTFQLRSRHEEAVILEFRFAAPLFAQSCGGPRSPGPG